MTEEKQGTQNIFPEDVLFDVAALKGDSHFQRVVDFLEKRRTKMMFMSNGQHDDVVCRWYQGRAQELNDIVESIKTAEATRTANQSARSNQNKGGALL